MSAATALSDACCATDITHGLQPIHSLNREVTKRWQTVTSVVEEKKVVIESTQQQLQQYQDALLRLTELLNRTEETMATQGAVGADVDKAKVNRDTLRVSGLNFRRLT